MRHKQDRHNCSLLLNLKLFLSDLSKWRVHLTGRHLPEGSPIVWQPPPPHKQIMGEDVKDTIVKYCGRESNSNIADLLVKKNQLKGHDQTTSKKRVSYFVSSMKKRRRERNYNYSETMMLQKSQNSERIKEGLGQLSSEGAIEEQPGVTYTVVQGSESEVSAMHYNVQQSNAPSFRLIGERQELFIETQDVANDCPVFVTTSQHAPDDTAPSLHPVLIGIVTEQTANEH